MFGRKIAAALLAVLLLGGAGACGNHDGVDTGNQGPGQSSKEDPTLGDPNGGGTADAGGEKTTDGADEGQPANGSTDNGSGTGAGRQDGSNG